MKYYTIQNGSILTSDNRDVLIKFYNEALELPNDYEEGKYIAIDGKLMEVKGFDEEKRKRIRKEEILLRLSEIDLKSIRAIRAAINAEQTKQSADEKDKNYIQIYEEEAIALRKELRELE